jgi:peptidoglycan/LPS O-acetylase OafA/YrhL
MVFLVHYGSGTIYIPYLSRLFDWGWVGVDLFFVLSGFLITGILYDTLRSEHFFKNFYIRRVLRIFPLFYGVWIAALLLTPVLHIAWNRYNAALAGYFGNLFYLGAYRHLHPNPGLLLLPPRHPGGEPRSIVVGAFWSLCVEEQFYLVWPAVVWLVRSRLVLLRISLGIIFVVLLLRLGYAHYHPDLVPLGALYYGTPFRVDSLFVGAAIGLWLRGTSLPTLSIRRIAYATVATVPAMFALGWIVTKPHNIISVSDTYVNTFGYTFIAVTAGALIVLALDPLTYVARWLQQRVLVFLGRISYGMYALHAIPSGFLAQSYLHLIHYHVQYVIPPLALAGTVGAAWLSFRYLEAPFLRLKAVLAPQGLFQTRSVPDGQEMTVPEEAAPLQHQDYKLGPAA